MSRLPLPSYELEKTKILKKAMISIPITQNLPKKLSKKLSMDDKITITDEKEFGLRGRVRRWNVWSGTYNFCEGLSEKWTGFHIIALSENQQ